MNKYLGLIFCVLTLGVLTMPSAISAAQKNRSPSSTKENLEEYLIRFKEEISKEDRGVFFKKYSFVEKREVKTSFGTFYVIGVPVGKTRTHWEDLMKKESKVKYIEPQIMYKAFGDASSKNPSTNGEARK